MAHQQYTVTLKQMVGRILAIKPNLPPTIAADYVNDAIRTLMDRRPNWSGLVAEKNLYVPAPITGGSVALTQGSDVITVSDTTWPVSDEVNTTASAPVNRLGLQTVVPASMDGITVDSLLYVDSAGNPEVVAVKSVTETSFTAKFRSYHNSSYTITASSYSNRQLRIGYNNPIYTIKAVTSPTTAIIDQKWLAADFSTGPTVVKMYYTIDPSIKTLLVMVDKTMGIPPLAVNKPVQYLNSIDPQRSATGYPQIFATKTKNEGGNMTYELWPTPQSARQLTCTYSYQPAILSADDDFIPDFVNPSVIFMYCQAMAWGTKVGPDDLQFDPAQSNRYIALFETMFNESCKADDEKAASGLQWVNSWSVFDNSKWNQSHSLEAILL